MLEKLRLSVFPTPLFRHPSVMMLLKALGSTSVSLTDYALQAPPDPGSGSRGPSKGERLLGFPPLSLSLSLVYPDSHALG